MCPTEARQGGDRGAMIPAALMLCLAVKGRVVRHCDWIEAEASIVLGDDDSRSHRQQGLQKPVVVSINVNGQHPELREMRSQTLDVVEIDETLACLDPVRKECLGQPNGLRIAIDEQTLKVSQTDAIVLRRVKTELQEGFWQIADEPRQDHAFIGLGRAGDPALDQVVVVTERTCSEKSPHAR